MVGLTRILAPANGMDFEDILSFVTEDHDYVGMWSQTSSTFILFAHSDDYFNPVDLGRCDTLDELDNKVYEECHQHIGLVSSSGSYRIVLEETD